MKRFRDYSTDQLFLMPPSLLDWLPGDHLVHFINEVVDELDLSAIYGEFKDERGQPPYHPEMMLKVWIYAYCQGIRSSRKVERAVHEQVGFRMLSGNQLPKYWALNEFRRRHAEALGDLIGQTVKLAERAGLLKLNQVAVDGTKVKANASKHSAMSYKRMSQEEKRLEEEIAAYLHECDEVDQQENARFGDARGDELPEHLSTPAKRLAAIRKAKAELEAEAREKAREEQEARRVKAEEEGRTFRPRKDPDQAQPKAKAQRNFTDPESRIMKTQDGFIQGFNAQLAVDTQSQIVVAADLTNQANDAPHLPSILEQVVANTGSAPDEVLADAGYWSEANVEAVNGMGAEAFIPPDKIPHRFWREAESPRGRIPRDATMEDLMRRKLQTKRGRERYRQRQMSVEPVIGQIKEGRGLRQFLHRGVAKVRAMWRFDVAVHNLMKMYRVGASFGGAR